MNQVIQSLVQSPYVRTLSSIPMKSEEMVHGVESFFPPLSRSQVTILPKTGRYSDDVYRFEIPRRDYLDGLTLVIRGKEKPTSYKFFNGEAISGSKKLSDPDELLPDTVIELLRAHDMWTNMVDNIALFSRNRFIENLSPYAISHEEYIRKRGSKHDYCFGFYASSNVFPSRVRYLETSDTIEDLSSAVWYIPLPLSSFSMLKHNFQTNFLEQLSLEVRTKFAPLFVSSNLSGYDMQLIASYHQFHPNVESVIRNANYKPSIPASLPWSEWVEVGDPVVTTENIIQLHVHSDALMSEMLVMFSLSDVFSGLSTLEWDSFNWNPYIVVSSNGETIVEGDALSLNSDNEIAMKEGDERSGRVTFFSSSISIRFGLRFGETFTGGLSLASLSNVVVSVYPSQDKYRGVVNDVFAPSTEVKLIMKRHYLLRIDSDTGVVSRSIES